MARRIGWVVGISCVVAAFFAGRYYSCCRQEAEVKGASLPAIGGKPVATFTGGQVTAEDVRAQFDAESLAQQERFAAPGGRLELLEAVVATKLFASAAVEKGLDRDPALTLATERALASRLLQFELNEKQLGAQLTEKELRDYYDRHADEFQRGERLRLSVLLVAAEDGTPAARDEKRKAASQLLADIKTKEAKDAQAFGAAARVRSDDGVTRVRDGDTGFLSREELNATWGVPVADAAFALKDIGKVSDVIEVPRGFVLMKLLNSDSGFSLPFDAQKDNLRARAAPEKRLELIRQRVDGLKKARSLAVDQAALESVALDPATQAR